MCGTNSTYYRYQFIPKIGLNTYVCTTKDRFKNKNMIDQGTILYGTVVNTNMLYDSVKKKTVN